MPKIKLEGMEKLQVKLKKNVQMSRADGRVCGVCGVWNPLYERTAVYASFLYGTEREVQIRFEKAYEVTSWTHSRNYSVRCFWN